MVILRRNGRIARQMVLRSLLRAAFADMLKDPDFIAACDQRHFMLDAGSGEEMDAIVRETFQLPDAVRAKIVDLLNGK
jgi:hypothetical protein